MLEFDKSTRCVCCCCCVCVCVCVVLLVFVMCCCVCVCFFCFCVLNVAFVFVFVFISSFDRSALSPEGLTSPQSNSTHSNFDSPTLIAAEKHGCWNSCWFQLRSRFLQTSTDMVRLWLAVTTWSRCSLRTRLLEQPLVSATKQILSNQY